MMIFQTPAASMRSTLKNHQIWQKNGKNEESLVQPFSPQYFGIPETQVLGTRSATNIHFKINVQTVYPT